MVTVFSPESKVCSLPTMLFLVEMWMQTAPQSHVLTAVCGDFELLHAANYGHGYALLLCVYQEQMDNGYGSLTLRSCQGVCRRSQNL